jgi:hypothetical protein
MTKNRSSPVVSVVVLIGELVAVEVVPSQEGADVGFPAVGFMCPIWEVEAVLIEEVTGVEATIFTTEEADPTEPFTALLALCETLNEPDLVGQILETFDNHFTAILNKKIILFPLGKNFVSACYGEVNMGSLYVLVSETVSKPIKNTKNIVGKFNF